MKETLNTSEDRCDIVCRAPSVLEDIEAQFPIRIDIRMEHLAQKFHSRGFVGVRFVKGQQEFECAILEWRIRCGISDRGAKKRTWPKDHRIPHQQVICAGRTGNAARRIG